MKQAEKIIHINKYQSFVLRICAGRLIAHSI